MKRYLSFLVFTIFMIQGNGFGQTVATTGVVPDIASTPMCSSAAETAGRCTGSSYCTACKNCSGCAYCNNGGSCGVCSRNRPAPRPVYTPAPTTTRSSTPSRTTPTSTSRPPTRIPTVLSSDPVETTTFEIDTAPVLVIVQSTSLRERATHESGVLTRLPTGTTVRLLEETDQWWWKVMYGDRIGYVKKACLRRN